MGECGAFPHYSPYGTRKPCKSPSGHDIQCDYVPVLYTFRVPVSARNVIPIAEIKSQYVKCPPFYLQLDHTLGVIWSLYSKTAVDDMSLGIAQLQWALNFLEGIYDENSVHPQDVAICIEAIQEELIQEYAQIADVIKEGETSQAAETAEGGKPQAAEGDLEVCEEEPEKLPFSVNYEEMSKNLPSRIGQFLSFRKPSIVLTGEEMDMEIEKINETYNECTKLGKKCPLYSRDSLMDFLKSWRKEQIEKIQVEIKRLQSIESFLCNADNAEFPPLDDILKSECKDEGKEE
ncbi:uncharacterized protein LOC108736776 [Agrilus planipennis]|uniref:Uncharacterized protein LOC108736776 n=1 Tax=Agrilus planipennis TaxID=224129 RepID=A0A1W4WLQ6_AGRPL|nr:uncharacterized protein LOC108736776 [Agrilus planipennis]